MGFKMPASVLKVRDENGTVHDILAIVPISTGNGGGSDGVGIASIEQTATSTADGGENKLTIALTDGTETTFVVRNGSKGTKGDKGDKGDAGESAPFASGTYYGEERCADRTFTTNFKPKILYIKEGYEGEASVLNTILGEHYITPGGNYSGALLAVEFTDTGFIIHGGTYTDLDGQETSYYPFDEIDRKYEWVAIG